MWMLELSEAAAFYADQEQKHTQARLLGLAVGEVGELEELIQRRAMVSVAPPYYAWRYEWSLVLLFLTNGKQLTTIREQIERDIALLEEMRRPQRHAI